MNLDYIADNNSASDSEVLDPRIIHIANMILNLSQTYVPVDTGTLKRSGHIEKGTDGVIRVVYDCPYATLVHEIIDYHHEAPTRSKFLEEAAYDVLALVQSGNEIPFTFRFFTDSTNGIWLEINSVAKDTFRLNEFIRKMYEDSLKVVDTQNK